MQKIKCKVSLLLGLLFFFTSFYNPLSMMESYAAAGSVTSSGLLKSPSVIGGNLEQWLLDETNGYIYAFSRDTDKLLFISMNDLKVKKEIKLSGISDIELFNGKLYTALESYRQIAVVDIKTAAVEKKLTVKEMPYKIALEGNKLFYILRHWSGERQIDFTKVYIYNLDGAAESEINPSADIPGYEGFYTRYHVSEIAADRENHRLYIGNSDGDSSFIFSISTKDYKLLSAYDREGFIGEYSNIILDGNDVFFGKYRLDREDLRKVYGSYDGYVSYVSGKYIFSANSIFDRTNFVKAGEFTRDGYFSRYLADSKGSVYLYEGQGYSVAKGTLDQFLFDGSANGEENPGHTGPVDYNADTAGVNTAAERLDISSWLVDAGQGTIYALSRDNNALLFIGLNDLKLKRQLFIGKGPSYMALSEGKLYIALSDINQVAVVDLKTRTIEKKLVLKYRPGALAADGNKLFYMGYEESTTEKFTQLYVYDLGNDSEKIAAEGNPAYGLSSFESNIILDKDQHVLYIGGETGNGVCAISTLDYRVIGKASSGVMHREYRPLVSKDGSNLYYSRFKIDRERIATTCGYFEEPIIYAGGGLAFSKNAVYDADNLEKVANLPFASDSIYLDGGNNVYLYDKDMRAVKKYSLKPYIDGFDEAYDALVRNTYYGTKDVDVFNQGRKVQVRKIVVDDQNDVIYAISPDSYKLLVIGRDDLKLKKEVVVGLAPKDMRLYDGKLYIAVSGTNYVAVVDTATLTVSKKLYLSSNPELVEVDGDKLFYRDSFKMYVYDISRKSEKQINFRDFQYGWDINYVYDIFLDKDNHILYAATSNSDIARGLAAINTLDLKPVKLPVKVGKYSSVKSDGMPVFDGRDLFRGQGRFNRIDYSVVSQNLLGQILYADNKYILTSYEAYLRSSNAKVGDMSEYIDNMHVDEKGNVYIIDLYKWAINKTSIDEILGSLKNKTGVVVTAEVESGKDNSGDNAGRDTESGTGSGAGSDSSRDTGSNGSVGGGNITFPDISTHWAKSDIEFLAGRQILKGRGTGSGIFAPEDKVTRAEYVTMLVKALGLTGSESKKTLFIDVGTNDWYYSYVMTASGLGLANGRGNGIFAPNDPITREEMAALSIRALKFMEVSIDDTDSSVLSTFNDSGRISGWARVSAAAAVKAGIINGRPGNLFAPSSRTTRAESAVVLKRLLDLL